MPARTRRSKIVFVGSFVPQAKDGTAGGQMQACRTLVESTDGKSVEWLLIDTTQRSLPPPGLAIRLLDACRRMLVLAARLASRPDCLLLFSSYDAPSFLEKGVMCLFGRATGRRVVWSIRSEVPTQPPPTWFTKVRVFLLRRATVLFCQSDAAANSLARMVGETSAGKLRIVPNWIDSSRYHPGKEAAPPVRFVFLGWCENHKGIRELIEAALLLSAQSVPFRLELAGGGSQLQWLREMSADPRLAGIVTVHGWVHGNEKTTLIESGHVLVLPSYTEGMPNAVLEGMAGGMAILATPVGGVPALVEHGHNGLLVPPRDAVALAGAMRQLAGDPALVESMGLLSLEKVRREHDISSLWPRISAALGVGNGV